MSYYTDESGRIPKKMEEQSKDDCYMFPQLSSVNSDINCMGLGNEHPQLMDARIQNRHLKQIPVDLNKYFPNELSMQLHGMGGLTGRNGNLPDELQNKKPELSYNILITIAINSSSKQKLTVSEIYAWFIKNFPYFTNCQSNWRNSIRHLLSINPNFVRLQRPKNESGKGSYWTLSCIAKEKGLTLVDCKSGPSSGAQSPILEMSPRLDHPAFMNSQFKSYSPRVRSDSQVLQSADMGDNNFQLRSRSRTMPDRNEMRMKARPSRSINSGQIPSREEYYNLNRNYAFGSKPSSSGMVMYQNTPIFPSPYNCNTTPFTPNDYSTSSSTQITPTGGFSQPMNHMPYDMISESYRPSWTNHNMPPNNTDQPVDFRSPHNQQQFNNFQLPGYQYPNGNSYFPKNLLETQELKRLNSMVDPNSRIFMSGGNNSGMDGQQNLNSSMGMDDSKNMRNFDRKME